MYTATNNTITVAVTFNGNTQTGMTSSDNGVTWVSRVILPSYSATVSGIAYGNGRFVVITGSTTASWSSDGITWNQVTVPLSNTYHIEFGNGIFVCTCFATSSYMTSTDGVTWTVRSMPISANWGSIILMNGYFYVLANYYNAGNTLYRSTDGINWSAPITLPNSREWTWFGGMAYGNGIYVITVHTYNSTVYATSTDGLNWTERVTPAATQQPRLIFAKGFFILISYNMQTTCYTSIDGLTWVPHTFPSIATGPQVIGYTGTNLIMLGSNTATSLYSP
jgi:hypothetical protein